MLSASVVFGASLAWKSHSPRREGADSDGTAEPTATRATRIQESGFDIVGALFERTRSPSRRRHAQASMTLDIDVLVVSCDAYSQYVPVCMRALREALPTALHRRIHLTSQTFRAGHGCRHSPDRQAL